MNDYERIFDFKGHFYSSKNPLFLIFQESYLVIYCNYPYIYSLYRYLAIQLSIIDIQLSIVAILLFIIAFQLSISSHLVHLSIYFSMLHQERERVMKDPGLSAVFVNPRTGDIYQEVRTRSISSICKPKNWRYLSGGQILFFSA